ncbi:MAG: GspE/PulE family protein [Sporichthyaceae bacterium]
MRQRWWPGRIEDSLPQVDYDTRLLGREAGLISIGPEMTPVEIVEIVLARALAERASDVHIEQQELRTRVRYRVDGVLHEVLAMPTERAAAVLSRVKVLAQMDIVEKRRSQDGQFTYRSGERTVDIRVSTVLGVSGEKCVLRLLESARRRVRYDELGMHPDVARHWAIAAASSSGMLLCSGPTGSGKTTTLYASLGELDTVGRNLCSIEDPVEYVVDSITQIQINTTIGTTFSSGLRSLLRQDPDVILVGEIRDPETGRIAVQSALTGHLVLSTVHSRDSVSALYRLLEMGIEGYLVTSSVIAVMAQRLMRRNCTECLRPYEPSTEERSLYTDLGGRPKALFLAGTGCEACAGTGYHERVGIYELLRVTPAVRALITAGADADIVRDQATAEGMHTLASEAVRLVSEDVTTMSEVLRAVADGLT